MDEHLNFIDFSGLNELQVENLKDCLKPAIINPSVEFPWSANLCEDFEKGNIVKEISIVKELHAPTVFPSSSEPSQHYYNCEVLVSTNASSRKLISCIDSKVPVVPVSHETSNASFQDTSYYKSNQHSSLQKCELNVNGINDKLNTDTENQYAISDNINSKVCESVEGCTLPSQTFTPKNYVQNTRPFSCGDGIHSNLNPLVSCFVPKCSVISQSSTFPISVLPSTNSDILIDETISTKIGKDFKQTEGEKLSDCNSNLTTVNSSITVTENKTLFPQEEQNLIECNRKSSIVQEKTEQEIFLQKKDNLQSNNVVNQTAFGNEITCNAEENAETPKENVNPMPQKQTAGASPSWADILKSNKKSQQNSSFSSPVLEKVGKIVNEVSIKQRGISTSVEEDAVCLTLGRHLYNLNLDFTPVLLQPRGLVNRRNWCYINATLQALIACSPFYTFLRNLPLGPGVERVKSSTPVLDSMIKLIYEFAQVPVLQEDMQPGQPFQPTHIYDMLSVLKPDCIKGQQEDAEEFLSYILNGMHEEMTSALKSYEKTFNLNSDNEIKTNGHVDTSEGEEEWKVMGSRQRGVVTRLVVEHKSPISDLLGGQIKSFLTINGSNSSASIQPFFTLQLDIQAENVTTVLEALNQMIIKEPIHGYTCPKTKQEVEAYSRSTLQKIPPILILHLKRFIYDKNGGCKKVMKKTEYPINLELKKDLFSPEAKKARKVYSYTLFAVMYHDGEEAIKGHYISDIYHYGSKNWIRCDDRSITTISENQVLSYNPPRVPYLLFYQMNSSLQDTKL